MNIKRFFDRLLTGKIWLQILIFTLVFIGSLTVLVILYSLFHIGGQGDYEDALSRALADILGADKFITYAFDGGVDATVKIVTFFSCLVGAIVFQGLLIATITNIFQSRADKVRDGDVHYKFNDHIVILGFNNMVPSMVRNLLKNHPQKQLVVAIETKVESRRKVLSTFLEDEEMKYVTVLHANRELQEDLSRLRVHKADKIYVIGEENDINHDMQNLNCFKMIMKIKDEKKIQDGHFPSCFVNMEHQSTFSLFQTFSTGKDSNKQIKEKDEDNQYFHPFNFNELWARQVIVNSNSEFPLNSSLDWRSEEDNICKRPDKFVHVVIAGMTEMGEAIAREVAFVAHYPNFIQEDNDNKLKTRITFVDENASTQMQQFIAQYASLFQHCHWSYRKIVRGSVVENDCNRVTEVDDFLDIEFEFIEGQLSDKGLRTEIEKWCKDEDRFLSFFMCEENPKANLNMGFYLPLAVYERKVPVWIYQPLESPIETFLAPSKVKNVKLFGMSDLPLTIDDALEVKWAMKINYFYENALNHKLDYESIKVKDTWLESKISDRWSSIYNSSSMFTKLRSVGIADIKNIDERIIRDNLEILAETEHNRWNVEKLMMGFTSATQQQKEEAQKALNIGDESKKNKLKEQFVHIDIRPFNQLQKDHKGIEMSKYDREFVLELSNIITSKNH